jgi:DNA topoisomerase-1
MTLDDALKMLSLPRVVGEHPESKLPITAQIGRYGPYISSGKDSRSIEKEEDVFSITQEQALVILAQPKTRGQRKVAEPIKEIGTDEFSGGVITLREGRFGLYVTDGETNASLRKGDSPESIDNARAQELLHQRRERAPVKKKRAKKKTAASAKAAPKKVSQKKAPAKNAGVKADSPKSSGKPPPSTRRPEPAAPKSKSKPGAAKKAAAAKKVAASKAKAQPASQKNGGPKSARKKSAPPSARPSKSPD